MDGFTNKVAATSEKGCPPPNTLADEVRDLDQSTGDLALTIENDNQHCSEPSRSKGEKDDVIGEDGNSVKTSEQSRFEPDKGWAWVVAFAAMLSSVLVMGSYRCLSVLIAELMDVYDEPAAKFGLILFWSGVGLCFSALVTSVGIVEIFHERALVMISGLVVFVGFMVAYISSRLEHIFILGFCTGVTAQLGKVGGLTMVGTYFVKKLALANGIAACGLSVGNLVFPPALQMLFSEFSYKGSCLVMAGIVLNLFVVAGLLRPADNPRVTFGKSPFNRRKNPINAKAVSESCHAKTSTAGLNNYAFTGDVELGVLESNEKSRSGNKYIVNHTRNSNVPSLITSLKRFALKGFNSDGRSERDSGSRSVLAGLVYFKDPSFIFIQTSFFMVNLSCEGLFQFYPALVDDLGIFKEQTTYLLAILGACDLVSRVVTGYLGDYVNRSVLVILAEIVLGVISFLFVFGTTFWSHVAFVGVVGLMNGVIGTFRVVILIDLFGLPGLSRTLSLNNLMIGLSVVTGGPIIGFLRDITGSYTASVQLLGASFILSALCLMAAIYLRRRKDRG